MQNAVYLINSTTLFEMFYGQPPKFQHLRVLLSLCYGTVTNRIDKFGVRADPAVHMGYSCTQMGYRLYSLTNKYFFVSRDVSFKESIFPFKTTTFTDKRPNVEHFVDVDDAFIIDPTPEVSEIDLDSALAPQPSPEVSSTLNHDVLVPEVI